MKVTELTRELVCEGYTKRIDIKNYWDAHGKAIPWGVDKVLRYSELRKFELYRVKKLWEFDHVDPYEAEFLFLYIDGTQLQDIGEITLFEELKTKIKLQCCVGTG